MPLPTQDRPGLGRVSDIVPVVTGERALRGREADREAVAKMLAQEWVRAGLVVGEIGVGKSAFLHQALVPHLRDAGMVPIVCEDPHNPTQAFAAGVQTTAGHAPRLDERPLDFLIRIVGSALSGRFVVFLLDDLDLVLRSDGDGRLAHELGDLLSRVCGRPGGKARFLFTAADTRMHLADGLERRTGSLFPITSRHALGRLTAAQAADALADLIAQNPVPCDPDLARAVADGLVGGGGVLPADLSFAALAIRDLGIRSAGDLSRGGGARQLCGRWIEAAASASGDAPRALRVLSELAAVEDPLVPQAADTLGLRAGVAPEVAAQALSTFIQRGVCRAAASASPEWPSAVLAHEALAPRVAQLTAPVAEEARRARALLAAAAERRGRLTRRERAIVERQGVPAQTAEEAAVLSRTRRFRRLIVAAIAAVPIVLLVVGYAAQSGSWHLRAGANQRLLVRAGDPSLSAFWWMPHSPSFGSTVADTGVTPAMVPQDRWAKLAGTEGSGAGYATTVMQSLHPRLAATFRYAIDPGDESALDDLRKSALAADDWLRILPALEPIARGGARESQLLAQALADPSPAVQTATLATAVRIEARKPGAYKGLLAEAMGSADATMRRQAYAAIRALPRERQSELHALALAAAKDTGARQQALAAVAAQPDIPAPAAAEAAAAILSDSSASESLEETAWSLLESAWTADPATAARAAAKIVADPGTPEAIRKTALRQLSDRIPRDAYADVAPAIAAAATSSDPKLRVAALPLHARLSPTPAVQLLAATPDASSELRAAQAEGWGELAKDEPIAVAGALEKLLTDDSQRVRAAAARAYGRLGRASQARLAKLVKEGGDVGEGAAWGLVASVEAGGSSGEAVVGLAQLWKKKGSYRRIAARAFARLARTKPAAALSSLAAAARDKDDPALRPIGVDGLCAALGAGSDKAVRELQAVAEGEFDDARARVAACLATRPDQIEAIMKVAPRLAGDSDASTRAAAAKALAAAAPSAGKGKGARGIADALVRLVGDPDRSVRLAALAGLAAMGTGAAGKEATQAVRAAYTRAGGEEEKLAVVEAAAAIEDDSTVKRAALDAAPAVRRRALGAAVALKADVMGMLQRGLADEDATVRREAVRLLGAPSTLVSEADALRLVDAALRDRDPQVANEALALLPNLSDPDALAARIAAALAAASEREREWGARVALGLAARDPKKAAAVLGPALSDVAHDVRVAAVPALAAAWAQARSTDELASELRGGERNAMTRLAAAWALYVQASNKDRREAVEKALAAIAKEGGGFVQLTAKLTLSLLRHEADGEGFLSVVVP